MKRRPPLALGLLAVVGLLAFGFVRGLRGGDDAEPGGVDEVGATRSRQAGEGSEAGGASDHAVRRTPPRSTPLPGRMPDPPEIDRLPVPAIPGEIDADEAAQSFAEVMSELDAALEQERKLGRREKGELYNRVTGSFTVLSRHANMSDPTERLLLEEAYARMRSRIAALDLEEASERPLPSATGTPPPPVKGRKRLR